jgi:RNase adapter protein RapZ
MAPAQTPFVILTGLSGAGKTQAIDAFEDAGYFCVDNLPPQLLSMLVDLVRLEGSKVSKVAVVSDVRGGDYFGELEKVLDELHTGGLEYSLVFLEASDEALVRRFKETRRRHPLAGRGTLLEGIHRERLTLARLRDRAHHIIDTSDVSISELKTWLNDEIIHRGRRQSLVFTFVSFGYKYGVPLDADLLFDVRFLPNPYYDLELRPLTGLDQPVRDYVVQSVDYAEFWATLTPLLDYLFPRYVAEGKAHLTIGIGCTGGRHRSVAIAASLGEHYAAQGFQITVRHRDISRD